MTTCEECRIRQQHVTASEQLLAEKRFKYRGYGDMRRKRILGSLKHQLEQARANLEHHKAECTEEKP